jgi:MurNAc alpha-1-phosphate uridylyltransferase
MLPIIVLAGGLATRLRPVTQTLPKSLIPINDIPFVLHQLNLFEKNGFTRVHFCLGFLGEMVEEVVVQSRFNDVLEISFSYDGDTLLGTGGAIRKVVELFEESFFVTYGDSYLDIDFNKLELIFKSKKTDEFVALMSVYKNNNNFDSSNVLYENGQIVLYSKSQKDARMVYIDYGVGILSKNCFFDFEQNTIFDLSVIYEKLSIEGQLIGAEVFDRFYEVGSFQGINDLSIFLKNKK